MRRIVITLALLLAPLRSFAAEPAWVEAPPAMMTPLGLPAGVLEGAPLFGEAGVPVGEIEQVFMTREGLVAGLAVELDEGFLGLGGREVILRFDQVYRIGDRVATRLSRALLEAQPRWE